MLRVIDLHEQHEDLFGFAIFDTVTDSFFEDNVGEQMWSEASELKCYVSEKFWNRVKDQIPERYV
jgi:hypothetical protein